MRSCTQSGDEDCQFVDGRYVAIAVIPTPGENGLRLRRFWQILQLPLQTQSFTAERPR
jgi:hypothetical protein